MKPAGISRRVIIAVLIVVVGIVSVVLARLLIALPDVQAFITRYPGTVEPAPGTPKGIPAWLQWQHYLNALFLVLIVRSALNLRSKQRPPAFFLRRNNGIVRTANPPRRISIYLWFHLSVDALWVINGIVFVALLFATNQWLRIVPTNPDVFPNAVSAALQYVSFEWPAEGPHDPYNSLQVLTYFATVFIAAPLAILTGVRLSPAWPTHAPRLNRMVPETPIRWMHNATLWFFIVFVIVHVSLVLLRNPLSSLNMMFGIAPREPWLGVLLFLLAMASFVAAWLLVRPRVLSAAASRFGDVK